MSPGGGVLVGVGICEEMSGLLGGDELAVVSAEGHGPVLVPEQVEERVGRALGLGRLDAARRLQREVAVLHRAHVPSPRRRLELQLERLVARDLVLVRRHVHA